MGKRHAFCWVMLNREGLDALMMEKCKHQAIGHEFRWLLPFNKQQRSNWGWQ